MAKKHRGRIQAQGNGLEKSVSWSRDEPLSKEDGLKLLGNLKEQLSKKELQARERELEKARRHIESVQGGEDAPSSLTFLNRKTRDVRVDIEIWSGTAFVSFVLILILILYILL